MSNKIKKIIIASGGTGGHIFPAYALAKHFIKNKNANVEMILDKRGLKYLKENHDLKITQIVSSTISKKISGPLINFGDIKSCPSVSL